MASESKDIFIPKVRIHLYNNRMVKSKTHDNDFKVCVAMVSAEDDVGSWCRTLEHKGIDSNHVAQRPMSDAEAKSEAMAWRLHWYRYKTWYALIRDEWRCTNDQAWIETLIKLADEKIDLKDALAVESDPARLQPGQLDIFESQESEPL